MATGDGARAAGRAPRAGGESGKPSSSRMALAIGLALGSVLTALVQPTIGARLSLDGGGLKDEARLTEGSTITTPSGGCTALAQDHFTGLTVAVDCRETFPVRPARRATAIES